MKYIEDIAQIASSTLTLIDIGARGGISQKWRALLGKYPIKVS